MCSNYGNGAYCLRSSSNQSVCCCPKGFGGPPCDKIYQCYPDTCLNGGSCVPDVNNLFKCQCLPGSYGIRCETKCAVDFYGANCDKKCVQSDSCETGHFGCDSSGEQICKPNWLGSNCQAKTISPVVDPECPNNILSNGGCYNGGTCSKKGCCCASGFTGPYCQQQVDNCIGNQCANNATCINGVNKYTCSCPAGYSGQYCSVSLNPCLNGPCVNGFCIVSAASSSGYYCNCNPGWTGVSCNQMLDNW